MNVGNVAQVDKGDKKLLQEDHEAQEADFGEELTPAIAQDYSNKLKDFFLALSQYIHGVFGARRWSARLQQKEGRRPGNKQAQGGKVTRTAAWLANLREEEKSLSLLL